MIFSRPDKVGKEFFNESQNGAQSTKNKK